MKHIERIGMRSYVANIDSKTKQMSVIQIKTIHGGQNFDYRKFIGFKKPIPKRFEPNSDILHKFGTTLIDAA